MEEAVFETQTHGRNDSGIKGATNRIKSKAAGELMGVVFVVVETMIVQVVVDNVLVKA